MHDRTAYGVSIKSNLTFDALPLSNPKLTAVQLDVKRVDSLRESLSPPTKIAKAQGRSIYTFANEHSFSIDVGSFLRFEFWPSSSRICGEVLKIVPEDLLRYWVLQQILPLLLLWNGSLEFLHGMAVSVDSSDGQGASSLIGSPCVGFLGDSYAGKSTLLSYFLSRGHALVGDEHLALSRQSYRDVMPATPYYRPYRAGEDLGLISSSFSPEQRPLQQLFLLEPAPAYADIELHKLTGLAAVAALLPHIQYNLHNVEVQQLFPLVAERFKGLAQLVRQVSVKRIYIPRSMDRLPEVYDFLQKELAS